MKLETKKPKPNKPQKKPALKIISTPKKSKYQDFLEDNQDIIFKALYNVRNTIKNKREVITKDFSKQYYRDYLEYNKTISKLKSLFNINIKEENENEEDK